MSRARVDEHTCWACAVVMVSVRVVEAAERNIITRTTAFLQVLTDGKYCYLPSRPRLRLPALHPKVRLRHDEPTVCCGSAGAFGTCSICRGVDGINLQACRCTVLWDRRTLHAQWLMPTARAHASRRLVIGHRATAAACGFRCCISLAAPSATFDAHINFYHTLIKYVYVLLRRLQTLVWRQPCETPRSSVSALRRQGA